MSDRLVSLTDQEQLHHNKLLRWKKIGMSVALALLMCVTCAVLYLLQRYENITQTVLYTLTFVMTVILFGAILMYRRFVRLITLDMQSHEKIVTTGIVVRTNFIGNNIYDTRVYGPAKQKYITFDVDGKWITLSGIQIKRLLPEVWQLNHVRPNDLFQMEFTPYGRHLMRIEKL